MPKKKETYLCEVCNHEYADYQGAEQCEATHAKEGYLILGGSDAINTGFPKSIWVRNERTDEKALYGYVNRV